MNVMNAGYLIVLGVFVGLLGVIGYVTHPEKAATSLMFGGGTGALFVLWGILGARGLRWSKPAAVATALLLSAACVWRAGLGWLAVANGEPGKLFASLLLTLTLAVSLVLLALLLKERKTCGAGTALERGK